MYKVAHLLLDSISETTKSRLRCSKNHAAQIKEGNPGEGDNTDISGILLIHYSVPKLLDCIS